MWLSKELEFYPIPCRSSCNEQVPLKALKQAIYQGRVSWNHQWVQLLPLQHNNEAWWGGMGQGWQPPNFTLCDSDSIVKAMSEDKNTHADLMQHLKRRTTCKLKKIIKNQSFIIEYSKCPGYNWKVHISKTRIIFNKQNFKDESSWNYQKIIFKAIIIKTVSISIRNSFETKLQKSQKNRNYKILKIEIVDLEK